ncbi:MAG: T9SS type A sorting domain-containing protein [Candidatus Eisenbacteria bacterium]|uniref:T9SS type A sorting domain-containing protein n=1 Tax=Eiseniibacteriota bacterium TaxID=2212470 RepID=A0A956NGU1_UNCEI|nr:T9SS type A sorting domain-containing protein [Candidatus Eisenbacteria bacterium]
MTRVRGLLSSALTICASLMAWNLPPAEGACDPEDHLLWKTEMRWPESISSTSSLEMSGQWALVTGTGFAPQYPFYSGMIDLSDPSALVRVSPIPSGNGTPSSFEIDGDLLFVASTVPDGPGGAVAVFPLTASGAGSALDVLLLSRGGGMTVDGDLVFVASDDFLVIDASDPSNLTILGSVQDSFGGLRSADGFVYASSTTGVTIIDVQDPANPTVVGSWAGTNLRDIQLVGNLLYVVSSDGVRIVDVADPNAPATVGFYSAPISQAIEVIPGRAYLVVNGDLHVLDLTDPLSPVLVGIIGFAGDIKEVCSNGEFLGLTGSGADFTLLTNYDLDATSSVASLPFGSGINLVVGNDIAYVADRFDKLRTIDVSDPMTPVQIGSVTTGRLGFLELAGDHLYATDGTNGSFVSIDVSDPMAPEIVGTVTGLSGAQGLSVQGNYAFLTGSSRLVVLSIADPTAPSILADIPTNLYRNYAPKAYGDYLYLGCAYGVEIFDISDPIAPFVAGDRLDIGKEFEIADGYLFAIGQYDPDVQVGPKEYFLHVYSLDDPANPTLVGALVLPASAEFMPRFEVNGGLLTYAAGSMGPVFVDVSDPTSPRVVGGPFRGIGSTRGAGTSGDFAFLADYDDGLVVVRVPCVSDPAAIAEESSGRFAPLRVAPNPSFGDVTITLQRSNSGTVGFQIFDAAGRVVRELTGASAANDVRQARWNGLDQSGRAVAPGVYFVRSADEPSVTTKVQIIR